MSTSAIRKALERLYQQGGEAAADARAAAAEVDAIERAAMVLCSEGATGDMVYRVRDKAAGDALFTGNTWEHPRVVAYGEAAQVIDNIAKESK